LTHYAGWKIQSRQGFLTACMLILLGALAYGVVELNWIDYA
jgi:hypothetical protein